MSKPVLHFWGLKMLMKMHPLHYVLAFNGLEDRMGLEEDIPPPAPWGDAEKWAAYPVKSPSGHLPAMVLPSGEIIGESMAIYRYIFRFTKLNDTLSDEDYAQSEYLLETLNETWSAIGKAHYSDDRTSNMDALFADGGKLCKVFEVVEKRIGSAGWLGPQSVCTPGDIAFMGFVYMVNMLEPSHLPKYPKLQAKFDEVQASPAIQAVNARYPHAYFKRKSEEKTE